MIWKQLLISNDRNRVRWVVLGLSQNGAYTILLENFLENCWKGDPLNATTFNPPLFSLVTFKPAARYWKTCPPTTTQKCWQRHQAAQPPSPSLGKSSISTTLTTRSARSLSRSPFRFSGMTSGSHSSTSTLIRFWTRSAWPNMSPSGSRMSSSRDRITRGSINLRISQYTCVFENYNMFFIFI